MDGESNHGAGATNHDYDKEANQSLQKNVIYLVYVSRAYFPFYPTKTGEKFVIYSYIDEEEKFIQKIGQYLSIADFHIHQIRKYDKILKKDQLKEFTRAIGLAANGVGIGSFIYLRRIFENLLEEAHQEAKKDNSWDENKYKNSRVPEKIKLLKDFYVKNVEKHFQTNCLSTLCIHQP